jgi:hypothetical protein
MALMLTRLTCEACGTELTGRFMPCPLCALTDDETALVQAVLAAGGDPAEVARHTGLGSDPLRARLHAIAGRLGLDIGSGRDPAPHPAHHRDNAGTDADDDDADVAEGDFLQRLARGVVEADDALRHP